MKDFHKYVNDPDDKRFINYLMIKFSYWVGSSKDSINDELDIQKNLSEYGKFSQERKNIILSRLKQIEGQTNVATMLTGVIAIFVALLSVYVAFLKIVIGNEIISAFIYLVIFVIITCLIFYFYSSLKTRNSATKYLYELLSKY